MRYIDRGTSLEHLSQFVHSFKRLRRSKLPKEHTQIHFGLSPICSRTESKTGIDVVPRDKQNDYVVCLNDTVYIAYSCHLHIIIQNSCN